VEYKKEVNHLLIYNPQFLNYLKDKDVTVLGYGHLDDFTKSIIKGRTVTIETKQEVEKQYQIYSFDSIDQEVEYLYNSIFDLLKNGTNINHIFVLNATNEYESYFKRFNSYYPFTINYQNNDSLYASAFSQEFLNKIDTESKQELYNYLVSKNETAYINIINNYPSNDLKEVKELIKEDLKNTTIKTIKKDTVNCLDINSYITDQDYIFLVGFNDDVPSSKKDTDYITDNLKKEINLPTCDKLNELTKLNTCIYLSNIKNLFLSYCLNSPFDAHQSQFLFENVEYISYESKNEYSEALNKAKYASQLDELFKFNVKNKDLKDFYHTYGKNDYRSYDNSYNNTNKIVDNVTLSYSSMNTYYECAFKYYLKNILKLNDFESNFKTDFGTVCHDVLKDYYEKDFDFETSWNNSVNTHQFDFSHNEEKIFEEKIKEELKKDIQIIKSQDSLSGLTSHACENAIKVNVSEDVQFEGFIDKIAYGNLDEQAIVSIIDYKTGEYQKIDQDLMSIGLALQLPSYLYLLKHSDAFKDAKVAGFYYQSLISKGKELEYNSEKKIDERKEKSMLLDGKSTDVISRLQFFDGSFSEEKPSSIINNLKYVKKDKAYKTDFASDLDINQIIQTVDDKVKEAGLNIINGNFPINPKIVKKEDRSCKYCQYKDICFKRNKDVVYIDFEKEEA